MDGLDLPTQRVPHPYLFEALVVGSGWVDLEGSGLGAWGVLPGRSNLLGHVSSQLKFMRVVNLQYS